MKNKHQVSISKKHPLSSFSFLREKKKRLLIERAKPSEYKRGQLFPKVTLKRVCVLRVRKTKLWRARKDRPHYYLFSTVIYYTRVQTTKFFFFCKIEGKQKWNIILTDIAIMFTNWFPVEPSHVVYPHNGLLYGIKKELSIDICYKMDKPWKHYLKWKKPVTKDPVYESICMKYPE